MLIQDGSGTIQLYLNRQGLSEEAITAIKTWDLGDIVAASGPLHRSGKGDLYINMEEGRLLTKALRPLPDKYHGLVDQETRYRQRYVDLIVNPEVREIFRIRAATIQFIRQFLAERQFVEVETPMLHPSPVVPQRGHLLPITTRSIWRCISVLPRSCISSDSLWVG